MPHKSSNGGRGENALLRQANECLSKNNLVEAEELFNQVLSRRPDNADALFGLGNVNALKGDAGVAIIFFERAMQLVGPLPHIHHNMAGPKANVGRFAEAETHFREALRLRSNYPEAYFNYSGIRHFKEEEGLHQKIEELLASNTYSHEDLCFLHFAAGKIYDDIGDYARAFEHYLLGNDSKLARFDKESFRNFVNRSLETFTPGFLRQNDSTGSKNSQCIFVVGMPRSGTTLVEQVLASHSAVFGAGELPDVLSISRELARHTDSDGDYPEIACSIAPDVYTGFGEAYCKRVRSTATGSYARYVDKHPNNFRFLGLIQLMLPRSKVIHCRRNALDTCLSCYFQNFRSGQEFSFSLSGIACFYAGYAALMDYWKQTLNVEILDLDYERFVTEPERTARSIVQFVGLDWEDNCLNFHETQREIRTASRWQVRQPISTNSVARWRHYERFLEPLLQALEAEGFDRSGLTRS